MAKERGVCIHYQHEGAGGCDLGKECEFWGHCQTCKTWKKKPGSKPARTDRRKEKLDKAKRKEDKIWNIN